MARHAASRTAVGRPQIDQIDQTKGPALSGAFCCPLPCTQGIKLLYKLIEPLLFDRFPDIAHQGLIVIEIVDGVQPGAQDLIATGQMSEIGPAIVPAGIAVTHGIERPRIILMAGIPDTHYTVMGKQMAVAGIAGRHDTVEHVYTATHRLYDIFRCPHPHQITWTLLRHPSR